MKIAHIGKHVNDDLKAIILLVNPIHYSFLIPQEIVNDFYHYHNMTPKSKILFTILAILMCLPFICIIIAPFL